MALAGASVSSGALITPGGAQGPPGGSSGGAGSGDMLKSVYDITGTIGIVDAAESVPWTGVTGKPSTFPPDSTAMLKSVYDTNANNKVDAAEAADSVPWSGVTGRPATFPATAHASTHLDNGTDVIPVATTSRTGLVPILNGNAATFLNGNGAFSAPAGTADPGVWTSLTLQSGWSAPSQAQYRIQTIGSVVTVFFRGFVQAAYSALGTLIANLPAGARPSVARFACLGGAQATGTASDVAAYIMTVSAGGNLIAYFLAGGPFTWGDPSQTQVLYLDGLNFSL